jgi:hypothetical protein
MGDSGCRLQRLLAAVVLLVAAGCSGAGAGSASEDDGAAVDSDRCDLDLNTERFNDTTGQGDPAAMHHDAVAGDPSTIHFTVLQWAKVFADPDLGMSATEVADAVDADVIYRRHVLAGVLTHTLDPDPWLPLTDPATCDALSGELDEVRGVVDRFPTVADAVAAGYTLGDSYFAGLGVHYQNWDLLGGFDPANPVQLLYDGSEDDAHLVGVSYVVRSAGALPPVGFTGGNDHWHRHGRFCLDADAVNLATDVLSDAECASRGGRVALNTDGWMLHVWVVPGCESDWGVFSAANPRLPYLPDGVRLARGCRVPS